jgi:neutral ceramidase
MKIRFVAAVLLSMCCGALCPSAAQAAEWRAGIGRAVITPTTPMWMSGYAGRDRPAGGKLHDLWVKALALEDAAGNRAVLVTLDLCGIDRDFSAAVRDRLQAEHGLGRESVALNCSHTHSGPVVGRNLRAMYFLNDEQQRYVDEYTRELADKIVGAAGEALGSLAPAKLQWASGSATFAVNRRNNPEPEVPALREKGMLRGPVDHDLPVMTVTGAGGDGDGKLRAVVFGYACHATTTSLYEWSGDWPGAAQIELERAHPGATAMFWAGCGADQNPLPRRTYEMVAEYGRQAAAGVNAALASGKLQPIEPTLAASYGEIDLPYAELPTAEQLARDAASQDKYVAVRATMLADQVARDGRISPHYPYPVQAWRLGRDVRFVLLGGEVVVDYALRLKKELGGSPEGTWVAGYTNDVMAYIPSLRVLNEGGYEGAAAMVYYGLPSKWAPDVEELIVKEVRRQAGGDAR